MKLKNSEIVNFLNLNLREKRLPIRLAFAIKLNSDKMQSAAGIYNEAVGELRKKYIKEDMKTPPQEFMDKLQELLDIETDINVDLVTIEELEKTELDGSDSLTFEEVTALSFMVE